MTWCSVGCWVIVGGGVGGSSRDNGAWCGGDPKRVRSINPMASILLNSILWYVMSAVGKGMMVQFHLSCIWVGVE